jgi:phage-related protein
MEAPRVRWRWYRTATGTAPAKEFTDGLGDVDHATLVSAMREVQREGLGVARHLKDELWELRATGVRAHYRLIFSQEGKGRLLILDVYDTEAQRSPARVLRRALQRLRDWRSRSASTLAV